MATLINMSDLCELFLDLDQTSVYVLGLEHKVIPDLRQFGLKVKLSLGDLVKDMNRFTGKISLFDTKTTSLNLIMKKGGRPTSMCIGNMS